MNKYIVRPSRRIRPVVAIISSVRPSRRRRPRDDVSGHTHTLKYRRIESIRVKSYRLKQVPAPQKQLSAANGVRGFAAYVITLNMPLFGTTTTYDGRQTTDNGDERRTSADDDRRTTV